MVPNEKYNDNASNVVTLQRLKGTQSGNQKTANFFCRIVSLAADPRTYVFGMNIFNRRVENLGYQIWINHRNGNIIKRAIVATTVATIATIVKTSDYIIDELIYCFTDPTSVAGNLGRLGYDVGFLNGYYDYDLHETAGCYFFGAKGAGEEVDSDTYIADCAKSQAKGIALRQIVRHS